MAALPTDVIILRTTVHPLRLIVMLDHCNIQAIVRTAVGLIVVWYASLTQQMPGTYVLEAAWRIHMIKGWWPLRTYSMDMQ